MKREQKENLKGRCVVREDYLAARALMMWREKYMGKRWEDMMPFPYMDAFIHGVIEWLQKGKGLDVQFKNFLWVKMHEEEQFDRLMGLVEYQERSDGSREIFKKKTVSEWEQRMKKFIEEVGLTQVAKEEWIEEAIKIAEPKLIIGEGECVELKKERLVYEMLGGERGNVESSWEGVLRRKAVRVALNAIDNLISKYGHTAVGAAMDGMTNKQLKEYVMEIPILTSLRSSWDEIECDTKELMEERVMEYAEERIINHEERRNGYRM